MIDTVSFKPEFWSLADIGVPSVWRQKITSKSGSRTEKGMVLPNLHHYELLDQEVGIFVRAGEDRSIFSVQASLPRVLFGHNGILLKSQADIDLALKEVDRRIDQIAVRANNIRTFSRVDLVLHFNGNPGKFIQAHRNFRFPGIRSEPVYYGKQGLFWRGSDLKVRLYDKALKEYRKSSEIVRLEFELHGEKLRKSFNGNWLPVAELNFHDCYRVFRRLAFQFEPSELPKTTRIGDLLAVGATAGWNFQGLSQFDLYTSQLSSKRTSQLRKEIAAKRIEYFSINWANLLPDPLVPPLLDLKLKEDCSQSVAC